MAHAINNTQKVTRKAVEDLIEMTPFLMHCARPTEDYFSNNGNAAKPGSGYTIKRPPRMITRRGTAMDTQNIVEETVAFELDALWGVDVEIDDVTRRLEFDDLNDQLMQPAMEAIGSDMEANYIRVATLAASNAVGTPGQAINNDSFYLTAGDLLTERGFPVSDRLVLASSRQISALVNANKALFHEGKKIAEQYRTGRIRGMAHGLLWYESTLLHNFTTGAYGSSTPLVENGSQSGSTLNSDGWESGQVTLVQGDVFYVNGMYAVTPQGKVSTGELFPLVLTAGISDTAGDIALPVAPAIKGPGDPHQNVNALPANNAEIFFQGSNANSPVQNPSTVSKQGLAFHKNALQMVFVRLEDHADAAISKTATHKATKVSVRFWSGSDIRSGSSLARFDVLAGMAIPYREGLVRLFN
jgi:hypothetical protein